MKRSNEIELHFRVRSEERFAGRIEHAEEVARRIKSTSRWWSDTFRVWRRCAMLSTTFVVFAHGNADDLIGISFFNLAR